jgi:hypothetical protein
VSSFEASQHPSVNMAIWQQLFEQLCSVSLEKQRKILIIETGLKDR